jgi:hypothetical protein
LTLLLLVEMEALDSGLTGEMWSRLINLGSELLDKCLRLSRSWRYAHRRDLIAKSRRNVLAKFPDECNTDTVIDSLLSFLENSFPQENSELRPVLPAYDLERIQFETIFNWFTQYVNEIEKTLAQSENDGREAYAVVVAAVVLLSYVYLYLTGSGGWDGSRAESSGSLDYRDTYIAIVLFRGAYVWIKFRDVAPTKRIPAGAVQQIKTSCKDGRIKEKYEPRFKPRKENGVSFNWIYLGRFDSPADAEVVYRMAASCYDYGKGYGTPLDLAGDGREFFTIIPEFTPAERTLSGRAKQELVKERVQELYKRYTTKKATLNLPPTLPGANLEQELENRRLQLEILSEQQQKEDLARQLQKSQNLQQAQTIQTQYLQLQVEDLQRQVQDQQAQQNLQQAQMLQIQNLQFHVEDLQRQVQGQQAQQNLQQPQQFQVPNLQPQPQLPHRQQQQHEEEPFSIDEIWDGLFGREPFPEESGFGAESTSFFWGYPTDE